MTTLQHPTQAQKVYDAWKAATKTTSLAQLAKNAGAIVLTDWRGPGQSLQTHYIFDDDTSITTSGRGKSYKAEVHLP